MTTNKEVAARDIERDWNSFWADAKNMALGCDQVHAILNVESMKEWAATGKSLDDALRAISEHLAKDRAKAKSTGAEEELP